ncbi:Phosphoenolpyruvate carboxylase [Bienertia sinuspersici]
MWWSMKRQLHKEKKLIRQRKDMDVDEHVKVQEMIVPGCCGHKKVKAFVKDDIRKHADFHKDEIDMVSKGVSGKPKEACSSQQRLSIPEQQV